MRESDELLLKTFAIDRDETAFRTLAERYLGLIFHTALRRTGNRSLAEEVSQNILCAMAKKASSLAKTPDLLPAWLHRATIYESTTAMRKEASHQRRKQHLPQDDSFGAGSSWTAAVPHLDQALDKLPESDRSVLLLHYFENRSFPKIAQTLGKNPTAVQKQSQRALEKLARILRGRGVTLTATTIAAGLTTELAKAAPVTLLKTATTAVLTGSASYSTTGLTLMFATKSKAFIPVVILLCSVPLALQQVAISSAKAQNDALHTKLYLTDRPVSESTDRRRSIVSTRARVSTNLDILVLVDEQSEARRAGGLKQIAFAEKIAALTPDILIGLIDEGAVLRIQRDKKTGILDVLISALADKDARLAVFTAIAAFPAGSELETLISQTQIARHFATWANSDPPSALAWYREQEQFGKFNPLTTTNDSGPIKTFKAPMIRALAGTDDKEVVKIFLQSNERERSALLHDALRRINPTSDPASSNIAIRLMPVIREVFTDESRGQALEIIGSSLTDAFGSGLSEATSFLNQAELDTTERELIVRAIAGSTLGTLRNPFDSTRDAKIDAELFAWLKSTAPLAADQIIEEARAKKAASELYQANETIRRIQGVVDPGDQELVSALMNGNLQSHRQEALKLAEKIKDPATRASTIEFLNKP